MRRNMDLIRTICLAVEANDDPSEVITPSVEGFTEEEVSYHIALMGEAGLIGARDRSAIGVYYWSAGQLTFAGHEFLDCVRDEALWNEVKDSVLNASGGLAFEVLRATLVERIRGRIHAAG